jgi:nucleoside-diphosphate-sugar epimerase
MPSKTIFPKKAVFFRSSAMTKIAVTGASGFLGRHVRAALSEAGVEVVAHARAPRPDETGGNAWTVFDLADAVDDGFDRLGRPDVVIHLAWGGLPNYLSPRHLDVELPAQQQFLQGLIASGLKRLVAAGTCFEYGMQSGRLHEELTPQPSNPYGVAKHSLHQRLEALSARMPFDLRWLRLFYLYGPGQAPTSLHAQFRAAVVRGDKTFDMSPADQQRDFMPVEDAAAAIAAVALAPQAPRLLNVCSGMPVTVLSLVERWRAETGADIELNPGALPYPTYEPFAFWGDSSRLAALLGPARRNR